MLINISFIQESIVRYSCQVEYNSLHCTKLGLDGLHSFTCSSTPTNDIFWKRSATKNHENKSSVGREEFHEYYFA